jgi:hypothetical protein
MRLSPAKPVVRLLIIHGFAGKKTSFTGFLVHNLPPGTRLTANSAEKKPDPQMRHLASEEGDEKVNYFWASTYTITYKKP